MEKGLKFCPTPNNQENQNKKGIDEFCRKLRLTEFFHNETTENNDLVHPQSSWTPERDRNKDLDIAIDYIQTVTKVNKCKRNGKKANISDMNKKGLRNLTSNKNIIIKEADKGSCVVIMNTNFYKFKMTEMLHDEAVYKEIQENLDRKIVNSIEKFTNEFKDHLSKKEKKFLTKFDYKSSQFYGLPKIHKSDKIKKSEIKQGVINIEEPCDLTFRPIVAGPQCPTHRLSHFLDLILQPFIQFVPAYIRDTTDLLSKLPETVAEDDIFITIDVKSLYTNISHELGVNAIEYWVMKYPSVTKFPLSFITKGILLILKNNTFQFNGKHYQQVNGTAMGTKVAPVYATLTLGYLEEKLFMNVNQIIKKNYYRYLDDILIIWSPKFGDYNDFLNKMKNLDDHLQFIVDEEGDSVNFLDVNIYKWGKN